MHKKLEAMAGVLLAVLMAVTACAPAVTEAPTAAPTKAAPTEAPTAAPTEAGLSGQLSIAGSTSVQPLAEKLAEVFTTANPDVQIDIQGGGTSVGVKSAGDGTVDIGTASRDLKDEERQTYPDLVSTTIARDGIAVIVNPDVTVDALTKAQVRDIFAGVITNWSEVGGTDAPIVVVSREEGSGTRSAFQEMVMGGEEPVIVDTAILQPSNGALLTTVATTPASIGYLSFGYLDESVKALSVDGVEPTVENALSGVYPVVRPFNVLTNGAPAGLAKAWIGWILSDAGQAVAAEDGYLPAQ